MSVTALLRIFFRWKRAALLSFAGFLFVSLLIAFERPLAYESQAILERKPAHLSPQLDSKEGDEDFDVYRLTSESQRSVALMKSRYMLGLWFDALGLRADSPLQRERGIHRLQHSLAVQPVSYTDLFIVNVRAFSPEEARRRTQTLVDLFAQWDSTQDRQDAQQLVSLLQGRLAQVTDDLNRERRALQFQKAGMTLSLGGSAETRSLEANINAKTQLYDNLTAEFEGSERELHNDALPRTRVLMPPTLPGRPVFSRGQLALIGFFTSLLLAAGLVCLIEWLDPTVHRTQDVVREAPALPVIVIPRFGVGEPEAYLGPLVDLIAERAASKGPTVVQLSSLSAGDGKTRLSQALAQILSSDFRVCLFHRTPDAKAITDVDEVLEPVGKGITRVVRGATQPLDKILTSLRERYEVILLDNETLPGGAPGSSLVRHADISCFLIAAGKTSRFAIRALRESIERLPDQRFVFVLNQFKDPLPQWLQSR